MGCKKQKFNQHTFFESKARNDNIDDIILSVASVDSVNMDSDNESTANTDMEVSIDSNLTGEKTTCDNEGDTIAEV